MLILQNNNGSVVERKSSFNWLNRKEKQKEATIAIEEKLFKQQLDNEELEMKLLLLKISLKQMKIDGSEEVEVSKSEEITKTVEKPAWIVEKSIENPIDEIAKNSKLEQEKSMESPIEKSIEKPMKKPIEKPIEKSIEKPIEKPVEKPTEKSSVGNVTKETSSKVEQPAEMSKKKVKKTMAFGRID